MNCMFVPSSPCLPFSPVILIGFDQDTFFPELSKIPEHIQVIWFSEGVVFVSLQPASTNELGNVNSPFDSFQ